MTQNMLVALGRLTLKFAALDDHVSWAYVILHRGDRKAAQAEMPEPFMNRVTCIRSMVESRAKRASLASNQMVVDFLMLLDRLKTIAEDRNLYIHGIIVYESDVDLHFVSHEKRNRKTGLTRWRHEEITTNSIRALNSRIDTAFVELNNLAETVRKMVRRAEAHQKRG